LDLRRPSDSAAGSPGMRSDDSIRIRAPAGRPNTVFKVASARAEDP
jgi:hypothetical protein